MKIYRPTGRADGYEAENLFPDARNISNQIKLRKYISSRLEDMARSNTLYLTDVLNQDSDLWSIAGQIILGQEVLPDSHDMITNAPIPQALQSYKVHVRSLNGSTIKWRRGMVRGEPIRGQRGRASADGGCYRAETEWVDTEETDTTLSLQDAWRALRQFGKHCRPAKRSGLQEKYWLYEEVRPEPKQQQDAPTTKGQRQKASFAVANG